MLFCCVLSIFAFVLMFLWSNGPYGGICAAIARHSVSLLRFLFLSYVQVFSCELSLVRRLKCPQCCFSSHFCFLVIAVLLILVLSVLFLVAVISLLLHFSMKSSSRCIAVSTLSSMVTSPFILSFLNPYCLPTSSLEWKN